MAKNPKTTKGSASQIQETATRSKPLSLANLVNQMGGSGTYIVNGFLETDYNSDVAGIEGLIKYDKMRKSDAQVRATLDAMELPILSTEWMIAAGKNEYGETDDLCEEIRQFVEDAFFRKMEQSWEEHMREVLTFLPMGFCVKEKVYFEEDGKIWLRKLAYRKQTTIYKWEQQDGTSGVTQILPTPTMIEGKLQSHVSIPSSKLLLFTYRKEGDNYAGVSVLRSAYRHWYTKDLLYKFDAIRHERQSVGIPYIKLPAKATEDDRAAAAQILRDIRANEQSGIVLPSPDWVFGFADLQAGNVSDVWKSIEHHNAMIAKNCLAMFMEIVGNDNGSRALSEDQSDFFLLSLESVAKQIDEVHSRYCINELVDLNFDVPHASYYPTLQHKKLGTVDYSTWSSVLSTLISAGVVTVDPELEDTARKLIDLPVKVIEDELEEELDENGMPIEQEVDENGEPIEKPLLDENGEEVGDELDDDDNAELDALEEELGDVEVTDEDFAEEEEIEEDEEEEFTEGKKFGRIVSEETKKKISEALKRRLPGDSEKMKNAVAVRKGKRMRSLTQRTLKRPKATSTTSTPNKSGQIALDPKRAAKKNAQTKAAGGAIKKAKATRVKAKKPLPKKKQIANIRADIKKASGNPTALKKLKVKILNMRKAKTSAGKAIQNRVKNRAAARVAKKAPLKASDDERHPEDHQELNAETQEKYQSYSEMCDWKRIIKIQNAVPRDDDDPEPRARTWRFNEIETNAWRPLTFAEKKVNFSSLKKALSGANTKFDDVIDHLTSDQKADILAQVKRAVENNDIAAVGKIKAKYTGDLSSALTDIQNTMFETGKKSVAAEIGVKVPPTAREVMGALRVQNDAIVDKFVMDMQTAASSAVTQVAAKKGGSITATGTSEAVAAAAAAMDKAVDQGKAALRTLSVIGTLNLGRATIFERYPEEVYAMQYSAIIDDVTTDTCLSLDGRVVTPGSAEFYAYSPPRHYNCRSIWVEILRDEEFPPEIGTIPKSIPSNPTIDLFEDLKAPVIADKSPAIKVLRQELEERETKVKDLEDSGLYPNRLAQHQERIDALKKSLDKVEEGE